MTQSRERILVTGGGGFIGHHLVKALKREGYWVRVADANPPAFAPSAADEYCIGDLRDVRPCQRVMHDVDHVYHLAANMGGIGFISSNKAMIAHDNVLIDANVLEGARLAGVTRVFYASTACVYSPARLQDADALPLREEDAYPADPVDAYGWAKLYGERLCRHYHEDYGLETRIARFHSMYGPLGTWDGGREKAPAAICRKVAAAPNGGELELWGDGRQTRTYCYVDDCVRGILALMRSDIREPVNLGSDRLVSIRDLAAIVMAIAGKELRVRHVPGPEGVRGRGTDISLARRELGWEPRIPLEHGMRLTYSWIEAQMQARRTAVTSDRMTLPLVASA